jgi:hypothetical protein
LEDGEGTVKTEISFIGDETVVFDDDDEMVEIKMTAHGVEVTHPAGEDNRDTVRVLYPWPRIKKITQTGREVAAIYHY